MKQAVRQLAQNKKATHDYFIEDSIEAGLSLCGTEVKSIRQGKVNLKDAYVAIRQGEAYIMNMHISPYEKGNIFNRDPLRVRKLLLHKREIMRLNGLVAQKGMALIPLSLYLKNGRVKLNVGIARGKKLYDKRQELAKKDAMRQVERHMAND